ncbi:MAG: YheT family hydrolase [Longimicrobiales bacterium]
MDGDVLDSEMAAPAVAPAAPAAPTSYRPAPFRASSFLSSGHAQTIAGKLLRRKPRLTLRRERWDTPDGDFVDLDFAGNGDREQGPIVLVLHGLEGSSRRSYVLMTYVELLALGMQPVGLNFRGCSGEPNRLPRFYHSGDTGDVAWVLERLRERFGSSPAGAERGFGAIGYSLGGNVLLKLLGERGGEARGLIDAAVAISVPYDLAAGSIGLEQGFINRHLYTRYFIRVLRRKTGLKRELLRERVDVDAAIRAATLRAFDEAATAPLHGFENALDYYARCSSGSFLADIRVPTLLIQAADDPFQPAGALPRAAVGANPWLTACFTTHGGHVGFIEGPPWRPRFWVEREAARFIDDRISSARPAPR